jgi:hypothetical protein
MQSYSPMARYGEMRKMREEKVTITILKWLQSNGWQIVCFDFPQSGTGVSLHPNQDLRGKTKNKGAIIADIIANKDKVSLFFENKDRFVLSDFQKINLIKTGGEYDNSIAELLKNYPTNEIHYGVGLPYSKLLENKLKEYEHLIDFVISVSSNLEVEVLKGKELFKN